MDQTSVLDRKRVLVIDDEPDITSYVSEILEGHQFNVQTVHSATEAETIIHEDPPDLILLDLGLPDLEGQTLASLLKGMPELAQVPIVAVTAWPPSTAKQIAEAYGCDGYISKPISPKTFPSQIAAYFDHGDYE